MPIRLGPRRSLSATHFTSESCEYDEIGLIASFPLRFRLRGDWSDTGPNARPEAEGRGGGGGGEGDGGDSGGATASRAEAESAEEGGEPREGEQQRQPAQDLQVIPELFGRRWRHFGTYYT